MASIQTYILKFLIRRMNLFSGGPHDPQILRARIERSAIRARLHRNVQVAAVDAGSVPSEWLIPEGAPEDRALLYLHGGAWFMGSARTHRAFVSRLAYVSATRALSINYRLAPEHPFPAGLDDCVAAYEWLLHSGISPHQIIVAGDSAGGNLTLALLVALRDAGKPLPAGAVALSPATDLANTGESYTTRRRLDPYFANMGPSTIIPDYITDHDPHHPLISPLYADLRGLPPLLIHVGDHEILLDDAVRFGECAAAAGVEVTTVVWPGMFHVFNMFEPWLPEAHRANAEVVGFIKSRLANKRAEESSQPVSDTVL